jgi:hypothetical protein
MAFQMKDVIARILLAKSEAAADQMMAEMAQVFERLNHRIGVVLRTLDDDESGA